MRTSRKSKFVFIVQGMTSDELEVWDEAQSLPDGLTIRHVHLETGTPAFFNPTLSWHGDSGFKRPF